MTNKEYNKAVEPTKSRSEGKCSIQVGRLPMCQATVFEGKTPFYGLHD